jgi:radical SAM protein with 4Fe4S-binding SPASM domain
MEFFWQVDAGGPFHRLLPHGAKAISLTVDEDTLPHFPEVLEEFAGSGLRDLHLPNVDAVRALAEVGHVPLPQPGKLQEAAETAARLSVPLGRKRVVVHDYFLWKHLRDALPEEASKRVEFSECRAASALAFVDWEGNVYPCESLPIRLGNLQDRTFEKIWRSPARKQIYETVRAVPEACGPCDQAPGCLTVCRGLLRDVRGASDSVQKDGAEQPVAGRS